jgi:hypothetical protein
VLHDDVNQRCLSTLAIVKVMGDVGKTGTAVSSPEIYRIGSKDNPNIAGRHMHMLDRSFRMGRKRSGNLFRRHHVSDEFHLTSS